MPSPAQQPRAIGFTYADYRTWPADARWELIDGEAFAMAPAPTRAHQDLVVELGRQIANALRDRRPCRVYVAPFDVRLPPVAAPDSPDDQITTVVQPDLTVICELARLDAAGCRGAPDWIIEVLSPGTAAHDQIDKLALYERHGVREYWLVHPTDRVVTIYRHTDGAYGRPLVQALTGATAVDVLPGLTIDWSLLDVA